MLLDGIYIAATQQKGRGVYTQNPLTENTIIEEAPVIIMPQTDRQHLDKTLLHDYIFEWGHGTGNICMALGYIPIYNHSYSSNCDYVMNYDDQTITIITVKNIAANEELTINYNGDSNDATKVWFDAQT
jgi:uncharacterized protein